MRISDWSSDVCSSDLAGYRQAVYSSGSVPAQRLLFGNSDAGDLLPLFDAFFDTAVGHKREAGSYRGIARSLGSEPGDVLFLSDVVEELDAARDAGMGTVLVARREDYPQPRPGEAPHGHRRAATGRAAWRERGGQYGLVPGVGVIMKKK